jgi:hypothetical protein
MRAGTLKHLAAEWGVQIPLVALRQNCLIKIAICHTSWKILMRIRNMIIMSCARSICTIIDPADVLHIQSDDKLLESEWSDNEGVAAAATPIKKKQLPSAGKVVKKAAAAAKPVKTSQSQQQHTMASPACLLRFYDEAQLQAARAVAHAGHTAEEYAAYAAALEKVLLQQALSDRQKTTVVIPKKQSASVAASPNSRLSGSSKEVEEVTVCTLRRL